jgi:hypothetical protein
LEYSITPYFHFDFPLRLAITNAIAATPSRTRSQPHNQLDIIILRHRRHTTAQQRTHQAIIMVHPICFDDTAVVSAPVADTDADINSEQAAAASRKSPSDDAPLPRKHLLRHGIKNKSFKKTTVAEHRPRTHDEREALKKPGTAPTMFAYLKLPPGRPKKKISTSNATATDVVTANPVEGLEAPSEPAPKK